MTLEEIKKQARKKVVDYYIFQQPTNMLGIPPKEVRDKATQIYEEELTKLKKQYGLEE